MDYGKAYTIGDSYRARAEQRQREYRAEELNLGWREWGHLLDDAAIASGGNFLTDAAKFAALEREANGKGVDHKRTWGNMLSSQAMCFNVFGTLSVNEQGRDVLASSLAALGLPVRTVDSIEIEFTPAPEVFGDQSALGGVDCDVLVRFVSSDDREAVLVMETKFVEPEFSTCGFRRKPSTRINKQTGEPEASDRCPEGTTAGGDGSGCNYQTRKGYRYWEQSLKHQTLRPEVSVGACPFGGYRWQLWTNHALSAALKPQPDGMCMYAVCAPKNNKALLADSDQPLGKLDEFRSLLREPETFVFLPVEDLIVALDDATPPDFLERANWLAGLRARYIVA